MVNASIVCAVMTCGWALFSVANGKTLDEFNSEERRRQASTFARESLLDSMARGAALAQSGIIIPGTQGISDSGLYREVDAAAKEQAFSEAEEKFRCVFVKNGRAWTNDLGKVAFVDIGQQWMKIDAQGRVLCIAGDANLAEMRWIAERREALFQELQKTPRFATKFREIQDKRKAKEVEEAARKAEEDRVNAIAIDEMFGIKFGSADCKYRRKFYDDPLGLSRGNSSSRSIRLPKPEFGFEHGTVSFSRLGRVRGLTATKGLSITNTTTKAIQSEREYKLKELVDQIAKRYGVEFKHEKGSNLYAFYQFKKGFTLNINLDHKGRIRVSAEASYVSQYQDEKAAAVQTIDSDSITNRLGRTKDEESRYKGSLVVSNFWGYVFGSTQYCVKASCSDTREVIGRGPVNRIKLTANASGELAKLSVEVSRGEYAKEHGCSDDEAAEALHREIAWLRDELEDVLSVGALASGIGTDLNLLEYSNEIVERESLKNTRILFRESKQGIVFSIERTDYMGKQAPLKQRGCAIPLRRASR